MVFSVLIYFSPAMCSSEMCCYGHGVFWYLVFSVLMYFSQAMWSSEFVLLWPWWAVLVFSVFFWYLVFSVLMYFSQAVWSSESVLLWPWWLFWSLVFFWVFGL